MKRVIAVLLVLVSIFVLSSCGESEKVSSKTEIFDKLDIGISVDEEKATDIVYSIKDDKIAKVVFKYDGHSFEYLASMKVNQSALVDTTRTKREALRFSRNLIEYVVFNLFDDSNQKCGMTIEWTAELKTGTYKVFYNLKSLDYVLGEIDDDVIIDIYKIVTDVVGM